MTTVEHVHARWCSGGCPRWLATGVPTCLPAPCRCQETRADAPDWVRDRGNVTCWWRKKTTGQIRSRCPCWGDSRDGKPGDCCAHHSANPRYLDVPAAALADPDAPPVVPDPVDPADLPPAGWHAPHERADWDDDGEPWGPDPARERKPFVRRWQPAELTCPCPTPWDAKKGPSAGVHCPTCHCDFANTGTAAMHRRRWTDPCIPPEGIVDVDTGAGLLRLSMDGVWSIDWAANAR